MKTFALTSLLACLALLASSTAALQTARASSEPPAAPSITQAKEAEIRKLLAANGTEKLMNQMKAQLFEVFRKRQPNVPGKTWDRVEQEMDVHELLEKLIPLYDKYLTLDDLKAANAFYASPAGQHISEQLPKIMADTSVISREWGREVALKVMAEKFQEEDAEDKKEEPAK